MKDKKQLKPEDKKFADEFIAGKSGIEAAQSAYGYGEDERALASKMASSVLKKQKVIQYLESKGMNAAKKIVELGNNAKNEAVKLNANKDILDRAGIGIQRGTIIPIQINIEEERQKYRVE